ncbi:MAG: T9SS type A sorting domain-containing protein [Ignavibacteriae bacterium]|nr:T9SS type A sorting domain-containing protein [Ignavibacteria bacterium]MBI3363938.1 T9SS type A sorting domain-containing protein [Ignavibacteriota bacterium]
MKLLIQVSLLMSLVTSSSFSQQAPWRRSSGTYGLTAALDLYRKDPDTLYAINLESIIRSPDGGGHWDTVASWGTDIGALRIDPTNSQIVYVSHMGLRLESNDILMSTDGGAYWRLLFTGIGYPVAVIEIDPKDSKTVYVGVGSNRVYRTANQGLTWDTLTPVNAQYLTALAIAPSNDSIIYAGFVDGLFKSTDMGNSWTTLSLGFFMQAGPSLAVDPRNPNIVYATVYNIDTTIPSGVFKTTDGGLTWVERNTGLSAEDKQIRTILIHPKYPDNVYIGVKNSSGKVVLHSADGGDHWSELSNGFLPTAGVCTSLVIDTLNNRMYAGAVGIYILDTLVTGVANEAEQLPRGFMLYQNFPNPFNPTTSIEFDLSQQSTVTLEVFGVLGKRIAMLVNEDRRMAGRYRQEWNANNSASGIYFCRLTIAYDHESSATMESLGHQVFIRKMLLLR